MAKKSSGGGGLGKVVLGFILAILILATGIFLYLKFGHVPVAVADSPFPYEKPMVKIPIRARIGGEMKTPPFGISEDVFESGAHIYHDQCAVCHGSPGHDSSYAKRMYPFPPQLWKKHGPKGVVGVSDDEPGFSHWVVTNGIRLSGMPSFEHVLTDTQIWQVSLLLKNADKELPAPVTEILGSQAH
jgi:thiosulfate dehydrogenase